MANPVRIFYLEHLHVAMCLEIAGNALYLALIELQTANVSFHVEPAHQNIFVLDNLSATAQF